MKFIIIIFILLLSATSHGNPFAIKFCKNKDFDSASFTCLDLSKANKNEFKKWNGKRWADMYLDEEERIAMMKLNRTNHGFNRYSTIILPITKEVLFAHTPIEKAIQDKQKTIIIKPKELLFGAYENGILQRWGIVSAGKRYCDDIRRGCKTPTGQFKVIAKQNKDYRSPLYPVGCIKGLKHGPNACAPMPFAMKFNHAGEALHGSDDLPGHSASHGCVRTLYKDSEWLSSFVELGTIVVVEKY